MRFRCRRLQTLYLRHRSARWCEPRAGTKSRVFCRGTREGTRRLGFESSHKTISLARPLFFVPGGPPIKFSRGYARKSRHRSPDFRGNSAPTHWKSLLSVPARSRQPDFSSACRVRQQAVDFAVFCHFASHTAKLKLELKT